MYVNERPVSLPSGSTVQEAVEAGDAELAAQLGAAVYVTDGVGRPIDPATLLTPGAILRVIRSARRQTGNAS